MLSIEWALNKIIKLHQVGFLFTQVCVHIYIYIYIYIYIIITYIHYDWVTFVVEAWYLVVVPIVFLRHSIWIVIIISTRVLQGFVKIHRPIWSDWNACNFMVADVRPFSINVALHYFQCFLNSYACQLPANSEVISSYIDADLVTRLFSWHVLRTLYFNSFCWKK